MINISLSVSVSVPQFKYNVCLVRLLISNQIMYATATKCTMNVRLAVIHSKKKNVASITILAWIMRLTET